MDTRYTAQRVASLALAWYRVHLLAFLTVNGALHALNVYLGAPWWALWPLLAWGFVFSIHFFVYKSLTVEDDWVQERVDDLQVNSYDFGHIKDIEHRVETHDMSVRPADEREDRDRG